MVMVPSGSILMISSSLNSFSISEFGNVIIGVFFLKDSTESQLNFIKAVYPKSVLFTFHRKNIFKRNLT